MCVMEIMNVLQEVDSDRMLSTFGSGASYRDDFKARGNYKHDLLLRV